MVVIETGPDPPSAFKEETKAIKGDLVYNQARRLSFFITFDYVFDLNRKRRLSSDSFKSLTLYNTLAKR